MQSCYREIHYDSSVGRFLQTDPHPGVRQNPLSHINKYIYAGNNPANLVDPNGDFAFLIAAIIIGGIIGGVVAHNSGEEIWKGVLIGAVAGASGYGAAVAMGGGMLASIGYGAAAGAVSGGVTAGAVDYRGGSFWDSFKKGAEIGAVTGGIGGGLNFAGNKGILSLYNSAYDKIGSMSWKSLISKNAIIGYGVTGAKLIANESCGPRKIFSWSAGGKCINKPDHFYETFL